MLGKDPSPTKTNLQVQPSSSAMATASAVPKKRMRRKGSCFLVLQWFWIVDGIFIFHQLQLANKMQLHPKQKTGLESQPSGAAASSTPQTKDIVASAPVEEKVEAGLVTKDGIGGHHSVWHVTPISFLTSKFYPTILKAPNRTESKPLLGYTG